MAITLTKQINMTTYFENLIIGIDIFNVFNTYVKFYVNWILFTI